MKKIKIDDLMKLIFERGTPVDIVTTLHNTMYTASYLKVDPKSISFIASKNWLSISGWKTSFNVVIPVSDDISLKDEGDSTIAVIIDGDLITSFIISKQEAKAYG